MTDRGGAIVTVPPNGNSNVTPRELYSTLDAIRSSLTAQIQALQSTMETKLGEMRSDLQKSQKEHERDHQRDRDRRNALFRWAVTTLITGCGAIVAIYAAVRGGG